MKKKLLLIASLVLFSFSVFSQQMPDPAVKIEAMSQLQMLIGKWEGSGWASSPDGSRNEFKQSEIIEQKLDGVAFLVQGIGTGLETGEIKHNALAIITYNDVDSVYIFQSHLATGQSTTAEGRFVGEKFIWGFKVPGGQVRYTISITENSKWNEYGEFSRDGSQWFKFVEMDLHKISEN